LALHEGEAPSLTKTLEVITKNNWTWKVERTHLGEKL